VPVWSWRGVSVLPAGAGYKVCVRPYELALSLDLTEATAQINAAMEQVVRELPSQYLLGLRAL